MSSSIEVVCKRKEGLFNGKKDDANTAEKIHKQN